MSDSLVPLISALRAEDTASPAALALAECARKIIFELIQALSDRNVNVRNHAVSALGRIGEVAKDIIPALIMAFTDEDEAVCECAAGALGKVGEPAIPALMEALVGGVDNQVRFYAAFSLGWMIDTHAVSALIEALKNAEEQVSETVEYALRKIGSYKALKAMSEE